MKKSTKVKINRNDYDKYDGQYTKEKIRRKKRKIYDETSENAKDYTKNKRKDT